MLTVDPAKRLTAASALAHPWIAAREQLPTSLVNPQVVQRLKRIALRSRLEKKLRFFVAQTLSIDEVRAARQQPGQHTAASMAPARTSCGAASVCAGQN